MDESTEFLICLGAAAVNCAPCFEYCFRRATVAEIAIDEVQEAVGLAKKVKTSASIVMRKSIRDINGEDGGRR